MQSSLEPLPEGLEILARIAAMQETPGQHSFSAMVLGRKRVIEQIQELFSPSLRHLVELERLKGYPIG